MPETASRAVEVRHLWRRHRVVVITGPSGSGRSNAAFAAIEQAICDGGRRGLVIEGRQGPSLETLRLWIATNLAVHRASGAAAGDAYAIVDDLHLLDDEAWGLVERLSRDEDVYWVMTVSTGRATQRVAELEARGAAVMHVDTVDTSVAAQIITQVWGRAPAPGTVDIMHELAAGRPGWIRKWAHASSHVAPGATAFSRTETAVYEWNVFQRMADICGPDLGVGEDAVDAISALVRGQDTAEDRALALSLGEAIQDPYQDGLLVAVPLLRRLVGYRREDGGQLHESRLEPHEGARRWLDMVLFVGALTALEGLDDPEAHLLRAEALVLQGRTEDAAVAVGSVLERVGEIHEADYPRLTAVACATDQRLALFTALPHPDVRAILRSADAARNGHLQEAFDLVDVGAGPATEPTAPGFAPLRRALAAWYAVLADNTVAAYRLMFGGPPSSYASTEPVSPVWEALLGDLHACTALVLGEWNRVGVKPEAFPLRANTWLRNDGDAWTTVASIMGTELGDTRLQRSHFSNVVHGLGWLHTLARVVGPEAEATSPTAVATVRRPAEPGLQRVLGIWKARAELLQRGNVVRGSDAEEKAAVAAGSTLARVQLALWGMSGPTASERASARSDLERLASVYGYGNWFALSTESEPVVAGLSTREREVCVELALGFTAAETAQRLGISPRTVEKHAANAYKKLEITSRSELAQTLGVGGAA